MYNILTIAQRTIIQLARDRRTLALIFIVPLVIASLFGVSIPDKTILNLTLPAMLATLILFFGFLLSGIAFLRERSQGTRERLMASPVSRIDILVVICWVSSLCDGSNFNSLFLFGVCSES